MTKRRGNGWGGARKGAGRPRGRRDRTYAELIEAAKRELATGEPAGIRTQMYFQIRDQVRAALDGKGEMPAATAPTPSVMPALHRLFADIRADLDTRLRRIEQNGLVTESGSTRRSRPWSASCVISSPLPARSVRSRSRRRRGRRARGPCRERSPCPMPHNSAAQNLGFIGLCQTVSRP
jgi:hypothetical protein